MCVEPRGGVRGSPVEMLCWPTHPQGLGTLSRHSPSLALSPLHAQTGKRQRGIRAASLSLAQSQGSKSRAGAAAEGWETSRTKVHTSHMLTGHFRSRAGGFHCQHGAWQGWGWHSAGAEPLRAQGRARIVNRATEPQRNRASPSGAAGCGRGAPKPPPRGCQEPREAVGTPLLCPIPWGARGMLHPGGCCIPGGSAAASPSPGLSQSKQPLKDQAGKHRVPRLAQGQLWGPEEAVCVTAAQTDSLRRSFYLNDIHSIPNRTCCFI